RSTRDTLPNRAAHTPRRPPAPRTKVEHAGIRSESEHHLGAVQQRLEIRRTDSVVRLSDRPESQRQRTVPPPTPSVKEPRRAATGTRASAERASTSLVRGSGAPGLELLPPSRLTLRLR